MPMPIPQSMPWRTSSYTDSGENCVEIGYAPGIRGIRDTKLGEASPVIFVSGPAFAALLDRSANRPRVPG